MTQTAPSDEEILTFLLNYGRSEEDYKATKTGTWIYIKQWRHWVDVSAVMTCDVFILNHLRSEKGK